MAFHLCAIARFISDAIKGKAGACAIFNAPCDPMVSTVRFSILNFNSTLITRPQYSLFFFFSIRIRQLYNAINRIKGDTRNRDKSVCNGMRFIGKVSQFSSCWMLLFFFRRLGFFYCFCYHPFQSFVYSFGAFNVIAFRNQRPIHSNSWSNFENGEKIVTHKSFRDFFPVSSKS